MILVVELKVKGTDAKSPLESLCGAKSPIEYPMHKAQWIEFSICTQQPGFDSLCSQKFFSCCG